MDPGDIDTTSYTAEFVIDQDDIDAGLVANTAIVTGGYVDGPSGLPAEVTDSDTEESPVANIEALPESFPPIATNGGVTTSVLASDTLINDPATLDNVTISVIQVKHSREDAVAMEATPLLRPVPDAISEPEPKRRKRGLFSGPALLASKGRGFFAGKARG